MNQRLTFYLSIVFGILLICIWLYIVDFKEIFAILYNVKLAFIFPLMLLFILTYFLRSLRWKVILSPVEHITSIQSFNLCMINYFINFLIPIHAGELIKSMLLKKMKRTPIAASLPSVYMDKATDLLSIFLLLIVVPFLKTELSSISYLVILIIFLILLFSVFFLMFLIHKKNIAFIWFERIFFFLSDNFKAKLRDFIDLFVESLSSLSQLSNKFFEIIGLTFFALIVHCFFMWLFFYSFNISLPVLTVLAGYLLLNASFIFPAPPGFSGSLELTFVFIFSYLFGYDKNLISAIAASSHLLMAIMFGIFGLLCMALIGVKISTIFKTEF